MILEIGRVCVKIAGREAGKIAVVVDQVDKNSVLIDGTVKRKKCNVKHLEPMDIVLKIKKDSPHSAIITEMKKAQLEVSPSTTKKVPKEKPRRQRKQKVEAANVEKPKKKEVTKKAKEEKKKALPKKEAKK